MRNFSMAVATSLAPEFVSRPHHRAPETRRVPMEVLFRVEVPA